MLFISARLAASFIICWHDYLSYIPCSSLIFLMLNQWFLADTTFSGGAGAHFSRQMKILFLRFIVITWSLVVRCCCWKYSKFAICILRIHVISSETGYKKIDLQCSYLILNHYLTVLEKIVPIFVMLSVSLFLSLLLS